jgi:hypothetical protein
VYGRNIYVLDGGFVLVGVGKPDPNNFLFLTVEGAAVVRRWGTQRGLGQLAAEGPRPNTALDPEGDVSVNTRFIMRAIPCNEEAWDRAKSRSR